MINEMYYSIQLLARHFQPWTEVKMKFSYFRIYSTTVPLIAVEEFADESLTKTESVFD